MSVDDMRCSTTQTTIDIRVTTMTTK